MARMRAARATQRDDAGMSLVEVLVAMFVTSILLAAVGTVFTGTLRGVRAINVKTSTTADARIAMEAMTRTLRVAYLPSNQTSTIASATGSAVSFYSLINRTGSTTATPLPTFVEYYWSGNCVNEAQTPGRINTAGVLVWDTGRIAKCLARTSVAPVFAYYTSGSSASAITIPGTGLVLTDRQSVVSIQASLTVQDPANSGIAGIPITDRITMINVQTLVGG
jgi:prepilin-type N-terminal cleavage/methylation domain-containing protein